MRTQILNSPARKIERLFNHIPSHLRNITERKMEYFKRKLDEWLMKEVLDQLKCRNYRIAARSNSIIDQYIPGRSHVVNLKEVSPLSNATIDSRSQGRNAHTHSHTQTRMHTSNYGDKYSPGNRVRT